jgi:hypothetical protein
LDIHPWVVWIHEFIHSEFYESGPSTFSVETKVMGDFSLTKEVKAAEDLEKLLMAIFQIDLSQQRWDQSALCERKIVNL